VVAVSIGTQECNRMAPKNIFQVVARAVSAAQKHQQDAWERHADLVIRPEVQGLSWDDFERASDAIEAGEAAARLALPRINRLLAASEHSSLNTTLSEQWPAETFRPNGRLA